MLPTFPFTLIEIIVALLFLHAVLPISGIAKFLSLSPEVFFNKFLT